MARTSACRIEEVSTKILMQNLCSPREIVDMLADLSHGVKIRKKTGKKREKALKPTTNLRKNLRKSAQIAQQGRLFRRYMGKIGQNQGRKLDFRTQT